jgi:hypothetical protein
LDIHFTVGTSYERAAPLAEKNAAARHHVLRSLISLHNEHRVYLGSMSIISLIKIWWMRLLEYVLRMDTMEKLLSETVKGSDHMGELGIDARIILQ